MKKNIIYVMMAMLVFASCRKQDNPNLPAGLARVPTMYLLRDVATDGSINVNTAASAAAFNTNFTADIYFKADVPPSKIDIVIIKNNDRSKILAFKSNITSWPTVVNLKGTDLTAFFGPIVLNDFFDVGIDITTQDGTKYLAFPPISTANGTGAFTNSYPSVTPGAPGINTVLRYAAICQYLPADYGGIGNTTPFKVTLDEWADFGVGALVPVTVVDATHLSFKSPVDGTSTVVLTINTQTNAISYTGQPYGNYAVGPLIKDPTWPYGAITAEAGPAVDNAVFPCEKSIKLAVVYRVAAGTFSNSSKGYKLTLVKQ